uniref:Arm DNA-binding domain-containing protein n=1 Tax=Lactiplantibacillus pentosus TaxID=1589 RepID=UPI0036F3E51F
MANGPFAVSYYDEFGKRHFKNKSGFSRKKEAEQWATKLEQAKFDQSIGKTDTTTVFTDYYEKWLETYKFGKVFPNYRTRISIYSSPNC